MTISKVASQNVSEIFSRSNGLMWQSCFSISRTTCINAIYKQIESDIAKTRQNTKRYLGLDQRSQRLLVPCRSLSKQCSSPSQCRSYPRSLDSCNLVAANSLRASGETDHVSLQNLEIIDTHESLYLNCIHTKNSVLHAHTHHTSLN